MNTTKRKIAVMFNKLELSIVAEKEEEVNRKKTFPKVLSAVSEHTDLRMWEAWKKLLFLFVSIGMWHNTCNARPIDKWN